MLVNITTTVAVKNHLVSVLFFASSTGKFVVVYSPRTSDRLEIGKTYYIKMLKYSIKGKNAILS